MQETKLIILLKAFGPDDLKSLDKFLKSPYFNTNPTITKLWNYVKKYAPQFTSNQLNPIKTYKKLFPKEAFNEKKLRQLRSRLLKLVEEFLAIESFRQNEFEVKSSIANAYRAKGMKEDFEKRSEALKTDFSPAAFLNSIALHQKLSLHHQSYFNELNIKNGANPKDLAAATELLEQYYIQQKLLYTVEWLSSCNLFNNKIPKNIKAFIDALEQRKQEQKLNTIQSIFENAITLLLQEDVAITFPIFIHTKQEFTKIYNQLNKLEKNTLLRLLINYCIKATRKGKELSNAVFELYQLGLSDKAIFQQGLMTNASFFNIVGTAIKLKKFDWGVNFINEESYRLYEPQHDIYQTLAKAIFHFYKEEYVHSLMLLSNIKSMNQIFMEISRRGLLLRAAFECYLKDKSYAPILSANIESFRKFLNRKEVVTDSRKDAFINFVRFLKKIVRQYEKGWTTKEIITLKASLLNQPIFPIEYKQWLLAHLERFKDMESLKATP